MSRPPKTPPRWPLGSRWFHPVPNRKGTGIVAPSGYAFNPRGDLVRIDREEARIGRAITLDRSQEAA